MENVLDKIIEQEYGGCNPHKDNPCVLKARAIKREGYGPGRVIEVFVVGKWRGVGRTGTHGLPSKEVCTKAIKTIRMNTGSSRRDDDKGWPVYDESKGTFANKVVMLKFVRLD